MAIKVNFDNVPDANQPAWEILVPPGWYHVRIHDLNEFDSKKGEPCWGLKLEHQGEPCFIAEDVLCFTAKALSRVKVLYKALGLPHKGEINCDPTQVFNQQVYVYLEEDSYGGKTRMKPVFDGYRNLGDLEIKKLIEKRKIGEKDIPF